MKPIETEISAGFRLTVRHCVLGGSETSEWKRLARYKCRLNI